MDLGKVIGNVVATKKDERLKGYKLLLVEGVDPFAVSSQGHGRVFVAVDAVGAGRGELVLVVRGSAARLAVGESPPIDATIVGIVDETHVNP
ncbi:MAG TPA: EutN/CcmL family microcompartment protein [Firmicutes bacterium]|jgi:ethanolamine utilization protein EutN|nr:EutN/CcmL family microcompartment protein [Bacillota bacterium]